MNRRIPFAFGALLLLASATLWAAPPTSYYLTDLGLDTDPRGINFQGDRAGPAGLNTKSLSDKWNPVAQAAC